MRSPRHEIGEERHLLLDPLCVGGALEHFVVHRAEYLLVGAGVDQVEHRWPPHQQTS